MLRIVLATAIAWSTATGCVDHSPRDDEEVAPTRETCAPPTREYAGWNHSLASRAVTALGSSEHGASDALAVGAETVSVSAKFAYGITFKDLEDETVDFYVTDSACQWQHVASTVTDDDGFATVDVFIEDGGREVFDFEFIVRGDDSRARGSVWRFAAGESVVIFDVDGTLTTGDDEIVEELVFRDDSTMRVDADRVVTHYAKDFVQPIFLTGRPGYLADSTRDWLDRHGMPRGPTVVTRGFREGLLDVERFKLDELGDFLERSLVLEAAYGNATTDICAYARAGIDTNATFIIGEHAGGACAGHPRTHAITSYSEHLEWLERDAPSSR